MLTRTQRTFDLSLAWPDRFHLGGRKRVWKGYSFLEPPTTMVGVNEFQYLLTTIYISLWSHTYVDIAVSLQTFNL